MHMCVATQNQTMKKKHIWKLVEHMKVTIWMRNEMDSFLDK